MILQRSSLVLMMPPKGGIGLEELVLRRGELAGVAHPLPRDFTERLGRHQVVRQLERADLKPLGFCLPFSFFLHSRIAPFHNDAKVNGAISTSSEPLFQKLIVPSI
jgi:hypothetical protein